MNDAASHAFLSTFRNAAAAMGLDPIAGGRLAPAIAAKQDWIWDDRGIKTECTEERAKRYAEMIGGTAYPKADLADELCPDCGGKIVDAPAEPADPEVGLAAMPARRECECCLLVVSMQLPRDEVRARLDARMMSEPD